MGKKNKDKASTTPPKPDMVNHPPHYQLPNGMEVIDIVETLNYRKGTAVKYIMRAGNKWNEVEDIEKAIWYLSRERDKLKAKLETECACGAEIPVRKMAEHKEVCFAEEDTE